MKQILKKFFKNIFGELNYVGPFWFMRLIEAVKNTFVVRYLIQHFSLIKTEPQKFYKKTGLCIVAVLGFGFGGYYGWSWYQSRPQPSIVSFQIIKPGITLLDATAEAEPLTVTFSGSVARLEDLNQIITDRIKLKPEINGTWSWSTDQILQFKPDAKTRADWQIGTKYQFEFKKSLFADHVRLSKFEGEFTTFALNVSSKSQEFYIDPKEPKNKKGIFKLFFSHPIQIEDLKSHLHMSISAESGVGISSDVAYSIQLNKTSSEAYVTSEALKIDDRPQTLKLILDKGYRPKAKGLTAENKSESQIKIPGRLTAFQITSVEMNVIRNQKYEPEQIIVIQTSLDAKSEDVAAKLKMKLLPKNKPAEGDGQGKENNTDKEIKNYPWSSASEITAQTQLKTTDIKFTIIPSEHVFSKIHTFRVNTKPESYAWIDIESGLKSLGDFVLDKPVSTVLKIIPYPEEISIMSEGSLLSLSGELKVPLMARNARNVEISISRIIPEQVNHLLSQISYDIKKPYYDYDIENKTTEKFTSVVPLSVESAVATQFFSFDLAGYLHKSNAPKGIFIVKAKILHADKTFGPTDQRLIMVTDLGLLVKETQSKNHEIFVQNLRSGLSVKSAQIDVIGRNGLTVFSSTTDVEGHTVVPNLKDFKNEKEPIAFSVRAGGDQSFLPFRNGKQDLQYSRFDVGGLYEDSSSEQIHSLLFSDRGIYRPGETVHVGLIIRSKTAKIKKQILPLEWSVTDPKGNVITKEKINVNSDDLKSIQFKTDETAPVGLYDVSLHLIKKDNRREFVGHQTIRVEEFQPDRLKIRTSLSKEKLLGWVKVQDLKATVSLRNLFGAAAEDRTIKAIVTLSPKQPVFKGYDQYRFTYFDQSQMQLKKDELKDLKTNSKGESEFELKMSNYESPYFSLLFEAEGFEAEAGKSVRASSSVMMSTLDFMIGAKPDGDLEYIKKSSERHLQIIAIDSDLKKVAAQKLTMEIVERKYVSVLTQAEDGNYKYQSVLKLNTMKTSSFATTAEGTDYKINSDLAGDFYLILKNKDNVELLKLPYTVTGEANLARSLDRNAELQLALNKKDYKVGEEIEMQIKAPYHGAGLISIERDGVHSFKWFKTETSSTVQKIKVPEGLSGNAYVTVTFLRAIDSKEIFMSPLSYAVVPFSISLDDRKTVITLKTPEKIKPGQKLKVQYSTNLPTDIILYGVDEGILQVAQYKLPDPLGFFFQKRALQVKTYQMLDLLMPEFSLIQQSQAAGGDEGAAAIGKNLNPFRSKRALPVAFWSGVIKADSKVRTYTYDVPDYFNGNIKIMAIAANSKNLGALQGSSFVRGDFIITPSTPVFVAPLDEFKVGLTISNQKEKSGDKAQVKLSVTANKLFDITKNAEQNLEIAEGHEIATNVSLKAVNNVGEGQVVFSVQHQSTVAVAKSDISVRPTVPYQNLLQVDFTNKNLITLTEKTAFFEPFAKHTLAASYSPISIGLGLLGFLESYPYGCTEQVISGSWPSLLMSAYHSNKNEKLNQKLVEKKNENIKSITRILRSRQTMDGGFSLYEKAGSSSNQAASLYAIEFLLDLQDKKIADVSDMIQKAKPFLQNLQTAVQTDAIDNYRVWAQALYLSAKLKVVNGASIKALRLELKTRFNDDWIQDTTAIYMAATYKLYKQDDEAEQLFKKFKLGKAFINKNMVQANLFDRNYFDQLSRDATLIYMSALYAGESYRQIISTDELKKLLVYIIEYRYHTFSAAHLLLAFDAMEQRGRSQPLVANLKLTIQNQNKNLEQNIPSQNTQSPLFWTLPAVTEQIQLETKAQVPIFYAYHKSGFSTNAEQKQEKKNIEIIRQYKDANNKDVTSVKVGDEVTVVLALRTTDEQVHSHIAIVDLLPGGFELVQQKNLNRLDSGNFGDSTNDSGVTNDDPVAPAVEENTEAESESGALFNLLIPKVYAQNIKSNLKQLYTDFIDQREDRVVVYATLTPETTAFEYKMKAVSEGRFRIPATFAEGMYNRDLRFVGPAGWIDVKSEK